MSVSARWSMVAVFAVALCLRPAITSVGPLLGEIGDERRLGESALGLLGTLPLLAFAVVSPLVHRLARRTGAEMAVLIALVVLAIATLARSYGGSAALWIGTVVIGAAIAVGNVLVPAIVKRDHPHDVSRATGGYSAFLTLAAATASAVAVPIAGRTDWRFSLAVWAVLAGGVALVWAPRALARSGPAPVGPVPVPGVEVVGGRPEGAARPSVWRQPTAWFVTAFMGLQSTNFYVIVNWLPTIEADRGVEAATAGVHLFVVQGVGVVGGLLIPLLLRRGPDQAMGAVVATLPMLVGVLMIWLVPALVVPASVLLGLGQGATLVTALSLISLRGRDAQETTRLSGMAQSLGYLVAAAGPFVAGHLAERTGAWSATLALLVALAALQMVVALGAGRERHE